MTDTEQKQNVALSEVAIESKLKEKTSADYYFDSYSHFGIHEDMLKDEVRTRAYMKAIMNNKHLFQGKTVLDVGCGTGILAMFAAKAGAKHVYAIERAGIYHQAVKIVQDNGLDKVITVIHGKVEEVELPVQKVDVIMSEWMGYFLLYESMLDTVIYARDKWLATGGVMLPDKATLYICGIEDAEYRQSKIDWWGSVYGFDMSVIKGLAVEEPLIDNCNAEQVFTNSAEILNVDLYTITKEQLDFESDFSLTAQRSDYIHAYVAYWSVEFTKTTNNIRFFTGPKNQYTHWKQTVFYLNEMLTISKDETVKGHIRVKRMAGNPRDLDIVINTTFNGKNQPEAIDNKPQQYRLR